MEVEGWSNIETWAINLHLDNDSKLSDEKIKFIRKGQNAIKHEDQLTGENVCWWVTNLLPRGIAAVKRSQYRKVNWEELAEDWKQTILS